MTDMLESDPQREEWVRNRRTYLGGSDASAIVAGGDEWRKLWRVKTGRAEPLGLYDEMLADPAANRFILKHVTRDSLELSRLMGHVTEDLNAFWYTHKTGREAHRRREFIRDSKDPFLAANLDGVTTTGDGRPAYIDFKHVGRSGEQLTVRYTAQCTHCAYILRCSHFVLSVFVGNNKWELTEQEVDPFFLNDYLEKAVEFWGYVERDEEPPLPEPLPVPAPQKLRIIQLDDEFRGDWPNWGAEMVEHFGSFASTHAAAAVNAIAKDKIRGLMPEDVGTITRGRIKAARDRSGAVRVSLSKKGEA